MTRFAMMIALCALCGCQQEKPSAASVVASPQAAPAKPVDAPNVQKLETDLVLPGTFSEHTTVADLQARFGKSNVKILPPADRTDGSTPVVLFPNDPTRRAYVDFHDNATLTGVARISVRDVGSLWKGKHGVHIGMSLAELRTVNGKPFYLSGFDSEHRSSVHDQWSPSLDDNDNKLGALDVEESEHMYFGVQLGLRGDVKAIPAKAFPHEEDSVSSDDPLYPKLGEIVEVTEINATTSLDDEWD